MSSVSVLTNALRLRRFRRPSSVAEILHPPLRTRLGQYAYLTGVAAVALALGAGLTAVSRMDFASRGMNGQLAWVQGTGMPMRPAMSVMMTAEVPPTEAADAGVEARFDLPADVRPGKPARLVVALADARTGRPIEDLTRSHEAWMHLIATRADLGTFAHVHPQPTGRPGELAVELTFPTAGQYVVNAEFRRQGQLGDVHVRQVLTVAGAAPAPVTLAEGPRSTVIDGVRVQLDGAAEAGQVSDLHYTLTDAATGRPVTNLQPYLAAAGHIVVMRADGATFAHEHAEVTDADGRPVLALPGTAFGPQLDVHAEFPTAGLYRLWAQFRLADGDLITIPFTVRAR
jgi:Cu+-exporting ATPase